MKQCNTNSVDYLYDYTIRKIDYEQQIKVSRFVNNAIYIK